MIKTVVALLMILSIDMMFFLGQSAMADVNPYGTQFYNYNGSVLSQYDAGNQTIPTEAELPSGTGSISPETGNIFTDVFTNMKEALLNIPVLGTVLRIATSVSTYLATTGLPAGAIFALNAFWYGITVFLIGLLLWGRE